MRPSIALAILALSSAAFAAPTRFVDYLYIEANEGGSSGGHAAIRFGEETYHFQHEAPGVLRLRRDSWSDFRYVYAGLENRPIHVSRAAVSADAFAEMRQRFSERYLVEHKLFAHAAALHDDGVVLRALLARRRGDSAAAIRLRGAGFFFPAAAGASPSAAVLALRRRVQEADGPDAIARRQDALRRELAELAPQALAAPMPEIPRDGYPRLTYPFSSRYRDLLTALVALRVLDGGLPLRADACWPSTSADARLDAVERQALAAFRDRLADELARLLHSGRPDWGFPLLVGMARLAALEESELTGRLVLLDTFPSEPELVPRAYAWRHADTVAALLAEAREELTRARARLHVPRPLDEAAYTELEAAGNRLLELSAASAERRDLRVVDGPLLPSRDASWSDLIVPDVPDDALARSAAQAAATAHAFSAELEGRYAYDLLSRNCVSEIFTTVGSMGKRAGAREMLHIVPFVSARAVNDEWDVVQHETLASYRRARLDEIYRRENRFHAWLRECNTLTSTIYRRNDDDSFFLMFTDDLVAPRPLFGAVNLAAGVGAAVAGVALLPFDHGHTLTTGVRGAVFSLPELAFVNLRKGSFDHVTRERSPGGEAAPQSD